MAKIKISLNDLDKNVKKLADSKNKDDNFKAFKTMLETFKTVVKKSGVLNDYKAREFYESKGEKRRKKKQKSIKENKKHQ